MTPPGNIYLCGFMGTGKSTVGRILARQLDWPLVDLDSVIEHKTGQTIASLFEERGEPYFRALETEALLEVARQSGQVVACGGGLVLSEENRQVMSRTGLTVGLLASEQTILDRTGRDSKRPLLEAEDKAARVRKLLIERAPLYEALDITLSTDASSPGQTSQRLVEELRLRGWIADE